MQKGRHYIDAKRLGKKIKIARIEMDLNQSQLAEKVNTQQKSISRYETGATVPSLDALVRLAGILKKPMAYFFEEG